MSSSLLLSVPFIFITSTIVYIFSISFYGKTPDIATILSYSLAAFMTVAFAISLTVLVIESRLGKILRLFIENIEGKIAIKFRALVPLYLVVFFYLGLISNWGLLSALISSQETVEKLTVIFYSLNPLSYLWLLGSYISKSLSVTGLFIFDPSSMFLNPLYIIFVGIIWVIMLIILPWAIFKKRDEVENVP